MTLKQFEVNIKEKDSISFLINLLLCLVPIVISVFFIYKFSSIDNLKISFILVYIYLILILFLILSVYALFGLFNPNRITYLSNKLSKEDNIKLAKDVFQNFSGKDFKNDENLSEFIFQKSIWSYKYKVYLFTDDNLLAIFVKTISSNPKGAFFDFGASKRNQKKIFEMLKKFNQ